MIVGVLTIRRTYGALGFLSALVFITAALELLVIILSKYGINNMPYFHLYTYIEFSFLFIIYITLLKTVWQRVVLFFGAVIFGLFSVVNLMYWESILEFNSNQRYVEGFIVMIMCVLFFLDLLNRAEFVKLESYPYFWLTAGFLTYFAGTLIVFYLVRRLESESVDFYWGVHGVLNIMLNSCYALTLWKGRRVLISS